MMVTKAYCASSQQRRRNIQINVNNGKLVNKPVKKPVIKLGNTKEYIHTKEKPEKLLVGPSKD